jgi:hypothetical protein
MDFHAVVPGLEIELEMQAANRTWAGDALQGVVHGKLKFGPDGHHSFLVRSVAPLHRKIQRLRWVPENVRQARIIPAIAAGIILQAAVSPLGDSQPVFDDHVPPNTSGQGNPPYHDGLDMRSFRNGPARIKAYRSCRRKN